LKILHITDIYGDGGGGASLIVDSLCTMLEQRGHENFVLFGHQSGPITDASRKILHIAGITDFRLRVDEAKMAQVVSFLDRIRPDVVQLHQVTNHYLVSFIANRYPSVLYLYSHLLSCPSGNRLYLNTTEVCHISVSPPCLLNHYTKRCGTRRPNKVLELYVRSYLNNKAAHLVPRLVAISDYLKSTLTIAGHEPARVSVINALSPAVMVREADDSLDYPSDSHILLFVGRITEVKGLQFLIKSLPMLKQDWHLIVAGDGYYLPQIEDLVAALGLQTRIEFKQWVPNGEMKALYERASVIVVPSIYPDPFVLVGLEAMRYARPVVAFDVGGISEWLEDGYNGFLCRHPDIADLAAKIDYLLGNKDLARQFGINGKQRLNTTFNPEVITTAFIHCYEEVISAYN